MLKAWGRNIFCHVFHLTVDKPVPIFYNYRIGTFQIEV